MSWWIGGDVDVDGLSEVGEVIIVVCVDGGETAVTGVCGVGRW